MKNNAIKAIDFMYPLHQHGLITDKEDINLQNMASNLHHGVVLADQGFGMLRSMIA